jgi:hypothetical protein
MSSWGKFDNAANAPYWAVNSTIMNVTETEQWHSTANSTNVAVLYGNTTSNVWTDRQTIGLFSVSEHETQVARVNPNETRVAHSGWVLKTTGQGGRAGRVQTEVLVAFTPQGPADGDGEIWANTYITITNPSATSGFTSSTNANTILLSTVATQTGNTYGGVLYQWQINNPTGSLGWTNVGNNAVAGVYFTPSSGTSATLGVLPKTTGSNNYVYRVVATAYQDASVSATSANAAVTLFTGV